MTATTATDATIAAVVDRFNAAWNAHDLDAAIALTSEDCVFESTSPAPDGQRSVGHDAIRGAWAPIFSDEQASFSVEDSFVASHRVVQQWRYDWGDGHVRGVDVIEVRDGLVTAKLAYVKG
jgi:ketosteroid isomerase-like protein